MSGREPWRLLVTWEGEPGWNMALDEALLASADPRPTLRFYTWKPHALSLGYFQRWAELEPLTRGRIVVRRFTGGGAIHHGDELTFSVAAGASHRLFRGSVLDSYERIHLALARALESFGARATLRGTAALDSERAASPMCFHRSTPFDLVWGARKGVGSAQRRRGGRVLHHGSIKLGAEELETGVATVRAHDAGLRAEDLARAFGRECEREFACTLEAEPLAEAEQRFAAARAAFYSSPAFLRRR
jgi:lipoate-protein ligase A